MENLKSIRNQALKAKGFIALNVVKDLLPGSLKVAVAENPHIPEIYIHKNKFVHSGVSVGVDDYGDIVATLQDGVVMADVFKWLNSDPFFAGVVVEDQAAYIKVTL